MTKIIRWILTVALIYGVYTETGKWTALALFLLFITSEVAAYVVRVQSRRDEI